MSLPSFLFASSVPVSSSPITATAGAAVNPQALADNPTASVGLDFRQAFMQMAGGAMAGEPEVATDAEESVIALVNRLINGEALSLDDQKTLQSFLAAAQENFLEGGDLVAADSLQQTLQELDLTPEAQTALAVAMQNAVANLPAEESPPLEEQSLTLEVLVGLLTGGRTSPEGKSQDAINLSPAEEEPPADDETHPLVQPEVFIGPAPHSPAVGVAAPVLAGQVAPAELSLRPKSADSPVLGPAVVDAAATEELADTNPLPVNPRTLTLTAETAGKVDTWLTSASGFALPEAEVPLPRPGPSGFATALVDTRPGALEQLPTAQLNPAMRLQVAFGHAQWSEALAQRAAWLAGQQIHSAELQLDPPELGPLQVRISVHQDQAVVSFVSANPQVRDALDQSMTRLRELMQEQGMQLVDAGVSDQRREGSDGAQAAERVEQPNGLADEVEESTVTAGTVMNTRYGVDDFV